MASELLAELEGHTKSVRSVLLSADGELLFSGGNDGSVVAWQCSDWAFREAYEAGPGAVSCLAALADGAHVASGGEDGTIRVWSISSNAAEAGEGEGEGATEAQPTAPVMLLGHTGAVQDLEALSGAASGAVLASAGADGTVRLWAIKTSAEGGFGQLRAVESGEEVARHVGHAGPVFGLVSSAGWLWSAGHDATLRAWPLQGGATPRMLRGHEFALSGVLQLSSDSRSLYSCSNDGSLRKWDTASGACAYVLLGHTRSVTALQLSTDDAALYSASADGELRAWRAADGSARFRMLGHKGAVYALALCPRGGGALWSAGYDSVVRGWCTRSGQSLVLLRGHASMVTRLLLAPSGERLFSAGADTAVRVWAVRLQPALPAAACAMLASASPGGPEEAEAGRLSAILTSQLAEGLPSLSPVERVTLKTGRDGRMHVTAAQLLPSAQPAPAPAPPPPPEAEKEAAPSPPVFETVEAESPLAQSEVAAAEEPFVLLPQSAQPAPAVSAAPPPAPDAPSEAQAPLQPFAVAGTSSPRQSLVAHTTQLLGGTLRPRVLAEGRLSMPASPSQPRSPGGFVLGSQVVEVAHSDTQDFAARVAAARKAGVTYAPPPAAVLDLAPAGAATATEAQPPSDRAVAEGNGDPDADFVARIARARS